MKFSKKYLLIDQAEYDRLRNSQGSSSTRNGLITHPNVQKVQQEDEKMRDIIEDDFLSDFDKVQLHSQALQRYLDNYKQALRVSKASASLGSDASTQPFPQQRGIITPSELKEEDKDNDEKDNSSDNKKLSINAILQSVPKYSKEKARTLLESIEESPDVDWTSNGKVKFKGKIIPESNIAQMTNDEVGRARIKSNPRAWRQFQEALKRANISKHKTEKQTGNGSKKVLKRLQSKWIRC